MKRSLIVGACAAVAALVAAAGVLAYPTLFPSRPQQGSVQIGGPFQLTDGDGHTVTDASLRGKWTLIYFGYTHCPDACPTALQDIANAFDQLGPNQRHAVQAMFITVDPARDTPAVMKDYVAGFNAGIVGLTGSESAITQAEKGYRVFAAKHPTKDGDYEMDHSSIIYVMDPNGRFVANFTHESSPDQIAGRLKQLGA